MKRRNFLQTIVAAMVAPFLPIWHLVRKPKPEPMIDIFIGPAGERATIYAGKASGANLTLDTDLVRLDGSLTIDGDLTIEGGPGMFTIDTGEFEKVFKARADVWKEGQIRPFLPENISNKKPFTLKNLQQAADEISKEIRGPK